MTTRADLLQAIFDSPADDAVRLVYADFLEETGDAADIARAALIRLQIEAARLPDDHPDRIARNNQAREMIDRHRADWFGWVRDKTTRPILTRGFLESWSCDTKFRDLDDLADAFQHEPITNVSLSPQEETLAHLATWPQFSRVRCLDLRPHDSREEDLVAFLSSPHLSGLRKLKCRSRHGTRVPRTRVCRLLAELPQFRGLSDLYFSWAGVGRDGMATLAASNTLTGLRYLWMHNCDVGDEGAMSLATSRTLTGLQKLSLHCCEIGLAGCCALLASWVLAGLTYLNLGGNVRRTEEGEELASLFASCPNLARLEFLVLDATPVNDRAAAHLGRANLPALKYLFLMPHDCFFQFTPTGLATMTAEGLRQLATSPWFRQLERLNLHQQPIGDEGAAVLADAAMSRLQHLDLATTGLTSLGLSRLVNAYSGQLRFLELGGNPLGDDGARVIAAAEWPQMAGPNQEWQVGFNLSGCGIGNAGVAALLASRTIPESIPWLLLGECDASEELRAALVNKYHDARVLFES